MRRAMVRRLLMGLSAWLGVAGLACLSQAQIAGFPPGTFQNRAALDGSATPPISFIQSAFNFNPSSDTTVVTTITGTVAGNFLVVGINWCDGIACNTNGGGSVTSVVSSAGETCTQACGAAGFDGVGLRTDIWYCPNIVGGSDTLTATFDSGRFYASISVSEWAGVRTASPNDAPANSNNGSGSASSLTVTTATNTAVTGELVICQINFTVSMTPTNGTAVPGTGLASYQIAGAPGSYNLGWTTGAGNSQISISLAAFKP